MGKTDDPCDDCGGTNDDNEFFKRDTGKDIDIRNGQDSDVEYGAVDKGFEEDKELWEEIEEME